MRLPRFFCTLLRDDESGVAMTEFALSAPFLMFAGMAGIEVAWLSITYMRVNQAALSIADNASRIGDTSTLQNRKIYEADINDLLMGANYQGSEALKLFDHGRVIISSLEVVPGSAPRQYIHWQRCMGKHRVDSSYGLEGDGLGGSKPMMGMGPKGNQVSAFDEEDAVIFVEINYEYQPLFTDFFLGNEPIHAIGTFNVRDDRDLSQLYFSDEDEPEEIADCSTYANLAGEESPPAGEG